MTISSQTNKVVLPGNGIATTFSFAFVGDDPSVIEVVYTDPSGNVTDLAPSQYSISLNAPVPGQIWGYGGTVTYPLTGSPIVAGATLTIARELPYLQEVSLSNQGSQTPQSMEQGLDLLEMQIQQLDELFSRAIVGPISDPPTVTYTLPSAIQRAGMVVGFDSFGDVIAVSEVPAGLISTVMQPFCEAASLAIARGLLGIGSIPLPQPVRLITTGHTDTALSTDWLIGWNVLYAGTKVETIPSAATVTAGTPLVIKDVYGDCNINPIAIEPVAGTIEGQATFSMTIRNMSVTLIPDGISNWMVI